MMLGNKKKAVTAILGPEPGMEDKEGGAGDSAAESTALAQEFIDAVHSKDPEGLVSSFKALSASCEAGEPEGE